MTPVTPPWHVRFSLWVCLGLLCFAARDAAWGRWDDVFTDLVMAGAWWLVFRAERKAWGFQELTGLDSPWPFLEARGRASHTPGQERQNGDNDGLSGEFR